MISQILLEIYLNHLPKSDKKTHLPKTLADEETNGKKKGRVEEDHA